MTEVTTPAGWYGQPDGTERFWTGSQWSDQVRPRPLASLTPPPPPPTAEPGWSTYPPPRVPQPGALVPVQPAPIGALVNPQLAYTQQGYVAVTQVAPKSPGLALLGSFFFPGLGQLINGQAGKGIAMFLAYLFSIALIFVFIGVVLVPAIWIWSMVDAYSGAKEWNARHGILS
jgi:TM2 domain-containing membrane protein YozV